MKRSIDAPWERLAPLPRGLWRGAVVTASGVAPQRLADLDRWRAALLQGALPDADADFGDAMALGPLRDAVARLALPALAQGRPVLAEQVLRTLLWHVDALIDRPAGQAREAAVSRMVEDFAAQWQVLRGDWEQMLALLPELGDAQSLAWADVAGLLRSRAWDEARRLAAVLAARPQLTALIRQLGRARPSREAPPAATPPDAGAQAPHGLAPVHTALAGQPGPLRGLTLGDRIERMPSADAQQLRHPVLHKLWRARHAEARLLQYDSVAEVIDWRPDPHAPPRERAAPPEAAPRERGPILVALDTSASMRGAPEAIAKAVVLEAVRTAHRERRGCRVIAFGAAGEVVERTLGLDAAGLVAMLELFAQGFDGGTDLQAPIERAIAAVHEAAWHDADLVIASDGEFGCTPATLAALDEAKACQGLRVHGILVGDRETMGLLQVSDHIHWVRDWREALPTAGGSAGVFSPVHSKSLTALYFPGALDARARRHDPGT